MHVDYAYMLAIEFDCETCGACKGKPCTRADGQAVSVFHMHRTEQVRALLPYYGDKYGDNTIPHKV